MTDYHAEARKAAAHTYREGQRGTAIDCADAASGVWEPVVADLKNKLDYLWGWIGSDEVMAMRDFDPEFVKFLRANHEEVAHAEDGT